MQAARGRPDPSGRKAKVGSGSHGPLALMGRLEADGGDSLRVRTRSSSSKCLRGRRGKRWPGAGAGADGAVNSRQRTSSRWATTLSAASLARARSARSTSRRTSSPMAPRCAAQCPFPRDHTDPRRSCSSPPTRPTRTSRARYTTTASSSTRTSPGCTRSS